MLENGRILLAAKYVPTGKRPIGGVQSWIRTVRAQLERYGHTCVEWEPGLALHGVFDAGVIANIEYTRPVLRFCKKTILFSHGIIKDERPQIGCNLTAAVSEEVRDHWEIHGPVIRQPIDLDFWRPSKRERGLCRFSYRRSRTVSRAVAERLGMPYYQVSDKTPEQAREAISRASVIHSTGRAALESMACDVPTVIYDYRHAYQPPYMSPIETAHETNYSGRGGVIRPTIEAVQAATEAAMQQTGWRNRVAKLHDARKIVSEILCLIS